MTFFDNPIKNLAAVGVLRINIWLFIPVPKIKFDPPPHALGLIFYAFHKIDNFFQIWKFCQKIEKNIIFSGKMLWCSYFKSFIKLTIFFQMWKFRQNMEFC